MHEFSDVQKGQMIKIAENEKKIIFRLPTIGAILLMLLKKVWIQFFSIPIRLQSILVFYCQVYALINIKSSRNVAEVFATLINILFSKRIDAKFLNQWTLI